MGPRGAAAVAVGLWVLVTAGEAADPGVTTPRRCLLSHYRSLEPRAVAAVKALRDRYGRRRP
ncbi:interferon lambda-4-like [Prionailurus iriomotensis]